MSIAYHHQLTQQFVAYACPVRPHEQSASAEYAFNRGRSRWWAENLLKECMQVFKCWVSPAVWLRPTVLSILLHGSPKDLQRILHIPGLGLTARRWCLIFRTLR